MIIERSISVVIYNALHLIVITYGKHSWLVIYLCNRIHFKILAEWVMIRNIFRISREYDVPELDTMFRKTVNKVEVKITKELREIMSNH